MTELEGIKEGAQPADKPIYFDDPALQALYQMELTSLSAKAVIREFMDLRRIQRIPG